MELPTGPDNTTREQIQVVEVLTHDDSFTLVSLICISTPFENENSHQSTEAPECFETLLQK